MHDNILPSVIGSNLISTYKNFQKQKDLSLQGALCGKKWKEGRESLLKLL